MNEEINKIIDNLDTEKPNLKTLDINKKNTYEILKIINEEDCLIAEAVRNELKEISEVVDLIHEKFKAGGRLIYIGAGSSGRLGILDASEMWPTYQVSQERIFGILAGGDSALKFALEGVEDDQDLAVKDLKNIDLNDKDILIGISASGRTPYVLSALKYCQNIGGLAIALTMTSNPELKNYASKIININTGQEVIAGSTRMKAGTATKIVLNMISTTLMIKCDKVYKNLMVDVIANNDKLKARVVNIIASLIDIDKKTIIENLKAADYNCKNVLVMLDKNISYQESVELLSKHNGSLSEILSK